MRGGIFEKSLHDLKDIKKKKKSGIDHRTVQLLQSVGDEIKYLRYVIYNAKLPEGCYNCNYKKKTNAQTCENYKKNLTTYFKSSNKDYSISDTRIRNKMEENTI